MGNFHARDIALKKKTLFGSGTKHLEAMGSLPSVFQADVHAIVICIRINLDRKYKGKHIAIMIDCQAANNSSSEFFSHQGGLEIPGKIELAREN